MYHQNGSIAMGTDKSPKLGYDLNNDTSENKQ